MIMMLLAALLAGQADTAAPAPAAPDIVVNGTANPCGPPFAPLYVAPMGQPFRSGGAHDPAADWFAQADTDHDGKITLTELAADADRYFTALDTNHDGEIDPQEVIAYETQVPEIHLFQPGARDPMQTRAERKAARRAAKDRVNYDVPYGAGRFASLNIPEPVASADLDINRGVSRAEFQTVSSMRFQMLDDGNRGYLSYDMLPKSPAQQAIDACRTAARKKK